MPIRVGIIGAGGNTTALHIPVRAPRSCSLRYRNRRQKSLLLPAPARAPPCCSAAPLTPLRCSAHPCSAGSAAPLTPLSAAAQLLQAQDGVEVAVVCNRSDESSQRVADEFNIPRIASKWTDIVTDPEIDAIVIGTWPYTHKTMVIAALQNDKHVMTEARMAMDATEAAEMLAESQKHPELICQIVPSPMTLKWDKTIQRLLRDGAIGDVLTAVVKSNGGPIDTEKPIGWREQSHISGMNTMGMGIFYEALRRWIGDVTLVSTMASTFVKQRLNAETGVMEAIQIPDHIDILAKMACGAQLNMTISNVTVGENFFELQGTEGVLKVSLGDGTLTLNGEEVEVPADEEGAWRVEEEFISAIRAPKIPRLANMRKLALCSQGLTRSCCRRWA